MTKVKGRVFIKSLWKTRLNDAYWLWNFVVYARNSGTFILKAKYPVGKVFTERVKKLSLSQLIGFEADLVDGEFFVTKIEPADVLGTEVTISARGKIADILPFYGGRKIVLHNDYGSIAVIDNNSKGNIGDEVKIEGMLVNNNIILTEINIIKPAPRKLLLGNNTEIDAIIEKIMAIK